MTRQLPIRTWQRRSRKRFRAAACVASVLALIWLGGACLQQPGSQAPMADSVTDGWVIFTEKQCLTCHAVWGLGGNVGPDLGRTAHQEFSVGNLAGALWNHVPKVYSYFSARQMEFPEITSEEMSDLYSFLFFVRYLDEPGDPEVGRTVLRERECTRCHKMGSGSDLNAPDLQRWAAYANPIVWAQKMWEHAPEMEEAMARIGLEWPELNDRDLANIIAYVRSVGRQEARVYLEPGSAREGAALFADHGCRSCHHAGETGTDLTRTDPPRSLTAMASRMWNHSPEMTRMMQAQGVDRGTLTPQEMADLMAYVISLRYQDEEGDAENGRRLFTNRRCAQCHAEEPGGESVGPHLEQVAAASGPAQLTPAMWNHGVMMLDRMSEFGNTWPSFQPGEMADLVAYFDSIAPETAEEPSRDRVKRPLVSFTTDVPLEPLDIDPDRSCIEAACHQGLVALREVHAPAAQRECGACHELIDPSLHRFALFGEDSSLCYQCHDHSPGTITPEGPVAVQVCTTCHNPHSAENLYGPNFTGDEMCFADMVGMAHSLEALVDGGPPTRVSGAIGEIDPIETDRMKPDRQTTPRVPLTRSPGPREEAFTPESEEFHPGEEFAAPGLGDSAPTELTESCVTEGCHASLVSKRMKHGPSAQQQCDVCHTVVDEREHRFEDSLAQPDLCYECHERPESASYRHGPVALGYCTSCHNPHSEDYHYMLPAEGPALCTSCHTEMELHLESSGILHGAIEEKGCGFCHDPHQSNHEYQLTSEVPELCYSCHGPIRDIVDAAVVAHEPVLTGSKCMNCHDPHASDVPSVLVDVEMNMCLDCHNQPMETETGTIIDMKSWIENNPERHGPIRNSNCTGCHQPHGSGHFRILEHEFPKKFYSPFSLDVYALCFECHEETLVLDERTTTLTDFRNGDKNLHYLHVNQEKGRTCRACHEIHAGTKPKRIKDYVPFGSWQYPVNFELLENGGRCAPGCHVTREYNRTEEVVQE